MTDVRQQFAAELRNTSSEYWESMFLTVILAYTLLLVYTTLGYRPDPQLFPLLVGMPLIGLILVRMGMLLSDRFDVGSSGRFQNVTNEFDDVGEQTHELDSLTRYRRQVEIVVWLVALVALIWALGFQVGLVAFVFAFVYVYERNPERAAVATVVTYGIVYLLFIRLLSVSLLEPALLPTSIVELLPGLIWFLP